MFTLSWPPVANVTTTSRWINSALQDIHTAEGQTRQQNSTLGTVSVPDPWSHTNTIRSTSRAHSPNTARLWQQRLCWNRMVLVLLLHLIRPLKNSRPSESPELPRTTVRYALFGFHKSLLTDCTKHCHYSERANDCFTSEVCCMVVHSSNVVNPAQQKSSLQLHPRWVTDADENDHKTHLGSHNNLCFQFRSSLSAVTYVPEFHW